jgi:hypothetical protein
MRATAFHFLQFGVFAALINITACMSKSSDSGGMGDMDHSDAADGADGSTAGDGGASADGAAGDGAAGDGGADPTCAGFSTGRAAVSGSCFGMAMEADLTLDAATCAYTLSGWSMDHGGLPTGGAIDGATLTLTGTGWEGCAGDAAAGEATGLCSDGCAWTLSRAG